MPKINPIFLLIFAFAAISWARYHTEPSPDLLATWMAGKYFGAGILDQIYPADQSVFIMRPPDNWLPDLRASGYNGAIYPFIYPPIWAWVGSGIYAITSFENFASAASFLNPIMLGTTVWLAARMVAEEMAPVVFVIVMAALFATSISALVALEQNQPQILVGFLMVWGVERTRNGAPVLGGVAMAIAASLKLYPAIFALLWWAQGERKASSAFVLFGGAVGMASIALTGWPLHAEFLAEIRVISGSVLTTFFTYSLDPTIAEAFFSEQMHQISSLKVLQPGELSSGWSVMAKPALWRLLDAILLIGAVVFLYRVARTAHGQDPLFWPMAFTLIALLSPLSWGYHYLPALAFAAGLLGRFGTRKGALAIFTVFFPISTVFLLISPPWLPWAVTVQPLATFAMALYAVFLWLALRKRPKACHSPLRA